jgi:hypothetical protein
VILQLYSSVLELGYFNIGSKVKKHKDISI